ncbi:MAG: hypothetical protein PWP47_683 [Synergistaceae bacterium]|jgi:hypothetical protein|nr:hypothetical protein [Synergistaceae bacterium]
MKFRPEARPFLPASGVLGFVVFMEPLNKN